MKKYKKTLPIISPIKIAVVTLCIALISIVIYLLVGIDNEWIIICGGFFITLMIALILDIIPIGYQYSYDDFNINLSYISIIYKKINYSKYDYFLISNASYNNGYGTGIYANIPVQYTIKGNVGHNKVTFPFITLHKQKFPINKITKCMSSRDLFMLDNNNIYCLGICWFDSLDELLKHIEHKVYVLEDVYLRFKGQFDTIFLKYKCKDNIYIISDCIISYKDFCNGDTQEKTGDGSLRRQGDGSLCPHPQD